MQDHIHILFFVTGLVVANTFLATTFRHTPAQTREEAAASILQVDSLMLSSLCFRQWQSIACWCHVEHRVAAKDSPVITVVFVSLVYLAFF